MSSIPIEVAFDDAQSVMRASCQYDDPCFVLARRILSFSGARLARKACRIGNFTFVTKEGSKSNDLRNTRTIRTKTSGSFLRARLASDEG